MDKPKIILGIEKQLKADSVFYKESCCCGNAWFIDYNYFEDNDMDLLSYRIKYDTERKNFKIVKYKYFVLSVSGLIFKSKKELMEFINKYLNG